MKKQILIILVALLSSQLFAQVTLSPAYPTADDEVTLTLDVTDTDLENYAGEIYAHTGVNEWNHVIGDWGNNDNQPMLTALGDNKFELLITPDIRQFYGASQSEVLTRMCFVFRAGDGSAQTSPDIFLDIYESLTARFVLPEEETVYKESGESIEVEAAGPFSENMELLINGEIVASSTSTTINYQIDITDIYPDWELQEAIVNAHSAGTTESDTFWFARRPSPNIAAVPDGMVDGINYIDDNTVLLSIFAPYHDYIFVIGDFNNWETEQEYYMNFDENTNRYWLEISGLEAQKEYIYQYLVDGNLHIGDPYADKVSDPWNDKYISNATYPNLISYPEGKTEGVATVLQTAQEAFEWEIDNFTPPQPEKMVVYELLMRDFIEAHDFQTMIDTLSYLKRLGVNVIELMPVNEFEGNLSWGYNPDYYFAPDKYYGPKEDVKAFIDECHKNDIAVVLDMVLNHAYGLNSMVRLWWNSSENKPADNSPYFNANCPHEPYCWGYDFNHESVHTQAFVDRINKYWIEEYKIDGFRFDYTKGFTNSGNTGYDATRIELLKRMADQIWATKSDAYVILEHWADNTEEKILANYGMMLWGNSNHNYCEAAMGWIPESNFEWISYKKRGWNDPHLVGFMESHDEERLMFKVEEYGNSNVSNYNIKDTTIGLQRAALAATFMIPVPGPKMIWQFGERGYDYSINWCTNGTISEDCRVGEKPPKWDYMNDFRREYVYNVYRALIDLKKNETAFHTSNFDMNTSGDIKNIKLYGANSEDVIIVGNFGNESGTATPGFTKTGVWYEFFTQEELQVTSTGQSLSLKAGEYRIYSTKKYIKPTYLNTGVNSPEDNNNTLSVEVWPNPATNSVNISFVLENSDNAVIEITDLSGRKVSTIENRKFSRGSNQVSFDINNYAKGIYIYKIRTSNALVSGKLIIE